jgi:hypothetical protein
MSLRNESLGRGSKGNSELRSEKESKVVRMGRVVFVDDPKAALRIKVRIKGVDDKFSDDELPWASPFLPKFLNIVPKVGEAVKVIFYDMNNPYLFREWVGPIISQPQKLDEDRYFFGARAGMDSSIVPLGKSIKNITTAEGVYPTEEDIAIQGRENTDIIFRRSEILMRAAKFVPDQPTVKNEKNPMSIHLRYLDPKEIKPKGDEKQSELTEDRTDINLMSNKIFLIGRDSNSRIVPPEIDINSQVTLENSLHPIVYGDVLYDFMVNIREWIFSHTHPYDRLPVNPSEDPSVKMRKWFTEKLPLLCSKNVFAGGDIEPIVTQKNENANNPTKVKNIKPF